MNVKNILMVVMIISTILIIGLIFLDNFHHFLLAEYFKYYILQTLVFFMIIAQALLIFYFSKVPQYNIKLFRNLSLIALIFTGLVFLMDISLLIATYSSETELSTQLSDLEYQLGFVYIRYIFYQLPFIILILGFFIKTHFNFVNKKIYFLILILSSFPFLFAISLYISLSNTNLYILTRDI